MTIRQTIEMITPERAREMLAATDANGFRNRRLNKKLVDEYARRIRAGKWAINGESLIIDERGNVIDGQHRLHAVIATNLAIETAVVRGVDSRHFSTINDGGKRNGRDIIGLLGGKESTQISAIVRALILYKRGDTHGATAVSNQEYKEAFYLCDSERLRLALSHVHRVKSAGNLLPPSMTGFCYYAFASFDREKAENFFNQLAKGEGLVKGDPVFHLRNYRISQQSNRKSTTNRRYTLALVIKAWNSFAEGRKLHVLKWVETESFPEMFGVDVDSLLSGENQ